MSYDVMCADPSAYEDLVPANGWGTHKGAVQFLETIRDACCAAPRARVKVWL